MVEVGLEVAAARPPWGRAAVGMVTHRAAVTASGRPGRAALIEAGARVVRLFSPEHGLESAVRAGQEVGDGRDALTGLPVVSLYGDRRQPTAEDVRGLEGVVVDLQDVGARCYTYLSTMLLTMETAASAGVPVWVLDRPNPVGGVHVEGMLLRPAFRSFVGRLEIPLRHGLTLGELARWARPADLELHVVPMRGWRRDTWWDGAGRPWVPPSPGIPDPDTALAYLATVLLEGTEWPEGRGSPAPYRVVAGPPPVRIAWDDRERFRPVAEGIRLLAALCERDGPRWRDGGRTLDLLFGSDALRRTLEAGAPVDPLIEAARDEGAAFATASADCRLYA